MIRVAIWLAAAFLVTADDAFGRQLPPPPPPPGVTMPAAPPRDNASRTGTARIRGRVLDAENGSPLRRAQVRISGGELREGRVAVTDPQGVYEFRDLPAGRYNVFANKGSYVGLAFGQTRPMQAGRPLEILDGQLMEKVDFALPHGSVVTGRVLDEYGEPVADVQVMPMRYQFSQGRRRMVPSGRGSQTNDIGEFRLFGLAPGQYYISATMRSFSFGDTDDRSGYAPTYYPGTANPAEAQRLKVDLGQTLTDVNMALVATRTAKVSGIAVDSQGRPLQMGGVMVLPRGGTGMFGPVSNGPIRPDGSFTISGVPPGDYVLRATVPGNPGDGPPEFATAEVTVSGEDLSGIRLATARMTTATGRIVFAETAASPPPAGMRVMVMPVNPDDSMMMMGGGPGGVVKDDMTFEMRMPPGRLVMRLNGPMGAWNARAIRRNGIDVTDGFDVASGADLSDFEIELTTQVSEISGIVTNARGEAAKDYTVLVFPEDRERWIGFTRYRSQGRPDQDGRFKLRALPASRYYAVALDYIDPNESGDPEFLERIINKSTPFTLGDGEQKVLDLKLQSGS